MLKNPVATPLISAVRAINVKKPINKKPFSSYTLDHNSQWVGHTIKFRPLRESPNDWEANEPKTSYIEPRG